MSKFRWNRFFPGTAFHELNIDWLLELTGKFDDRMTAAEKKNDEQDERLDEHDVLIDDLRDDLDAEIAARIAGDDSLSNRITSEVSARIAGDTRLQENIDAEASARQSADATLQANIDAEATARQNGDNTLQTNLNAAITTVMANLQQEQNNRITMDEGLLNMINTEITNRTNADTAINTRIDNLPTPETVIANPAGTGTTDLSKLQVGSTIYNVPSGGSGTDVEANPSGTATADLNKLRVGTDIYSIPSANPGAVLYNMYILFDRDENDEYRVRYVRVGPNEDPSTATWTNACTSGAGVDLFVMYLIQSMYNEATSGYQKQSYKIILIDSFDYPKPNGDMWEPTDINHTNSHYAPFIYPEIITHRDGDTGTYPSGRFRAELLWDGNKLEFTYDNQGGGICPGVIKFNDFDDDPIYAKVNSSGYIVYNHDSSQYPGYYQLTASNLSVVYDTDDNPYHLWDHNVDDPTNELPILYRYISAASTTGYTVKTMVLVADTTTSPYRFKVAKIITENVT